MQRPTRVRRQTFKALDSQSNALSVDAIADTRVAKKRKLHALQPVPVEPIAAPEILEDPLPNYQPPLRLQPFASRLRIRPQSPIEAFQLFLTHEIINIIVANTNSYAEDHREAAPARNFDYSRPWRPTRASEIWRYIGCFFYIGIYIKKERAEY
jgi:Transposase IS4